MPKYTSDRAVVNQVNLNGGLNDTSGPLSLQDNESSDLQNVDFDKFGSVLTRNGYLNLTTAAITGTPDIDGLWYYQNQTADKAICVAGDKLYKMDDLDGTWDDITGGITITAGNHCDFENFLNTMLATNGEDAPFYYDGSSVATMTVPTGLTKAKFVTQYENYTILANVTVSGTAYPSRWYWSTINTIATWNAADWIATSKNDGQQIMGCKVLGDAVLIFKERAIYKYVFTGDRDVPFIGVKTPSSVGCVAPWSIQEVDNGLVFLSYDGFYFFDGNNSYKLSDRINNTILNLNRSKFENVVSCVQKDKNKYMAAVTTSGQSENDQVIVWDYFNNAWSIYDGMAPSSMATFWIDDIQERPYFGDYAGFVYRMDVGIDDYPLSVKTAIDSYYYTNWRHFGDLADQKGVGNIYLYHQFANTVLTLAYSYDFETNDQYTQTFSLSTSSDTYGSGIYGTAVYGGSGGTVTRRDFTGMGRVIRVKFATNSLGENFQIDGIGSLVNLETFT